jgi:hypothetical protein
MPAQDPTGIQNQTHTCSTLVSLLKGSNGQYSSACVAHPAGIPDWEGGPCGYDSIQVVNEPFFGGDGVPFWRTSISVYPYNCRAAAIGGSDLHSQYQSMGEATWLYSPAWSSAVTWTAKVNALAGALKAGKTSATEGASLSYFTMDGAMPGSTLTKAIGSYVYYNIYAYAPNNGYQVQVRWDFYRGSTWLNGGTSAVLSSGSTYSVTGLRTTVQQYRQGYRTETRFDYIQGGNVFFSERVFCGPTYTQQ